MKKPVFIYLGYLLTALLLGATPAFSQAATHLAITSVNGGTNPQAGVAFSVTVFAQDVSNLPSNVVLPTNVSLSLNTGTGTLGGTVTGTILAGTDSVVISGVTYTKAESGVIITATETSGDPLTAANSGPFTVVAGPAAKLAFTTQPGNGTGGSPLTTQPVVTLQDAQGNTVTGTAQTVTLAIQNNAGPGGVLGGTTSMAVNTGNGQAAFTNISIDKIGTGYTLTATGSTVSTTPGVVVSTAFNVTLGAAAKLDFGQEPTNASGGATITPAITVRIEDAGGNLFNDSRSVTLAIGTNPSGGTLSGTLTQAASGGIATFNNLSIDKAGTGYTLNATASGVAPAASNTFNIIVGGAAKVAFTTQPGGGTGGSAFPTQPVVTLEDAGGNAVTGVAQNVTLAIQNNAGGGTLGGTTTLAVNTGTGHAVFTNISIDKIGTGYTLTATGSTVSTTPGVVVSTAFNVVTGPAAKLAFTTQPGNGTGGSALSTQPVLTLQDAGGNTVTGTAQNVTLAFQNNAGGGTLSGTNPVAVNTATGLATFTNIAVDKIGTGYTLTATGSTVSTTPGVVVSSAFNVTVGTAAKLGFTQQPTSTSAGATITPAVTVSVEDLGGNTVNDSRSITLAIGTNPSGGVLSGTLTQSAVAGTATFNNLSIDKSGTGYTLTASSSPILTGATSSAFNIVTGGAVKLAFTTQPGNGTGGSALSTQPVVTLEDAGGNAVTGSAQNVTLAIQNNAGPGGVLSGTTTVAVNTTTGQATFTNLSIDKIGTGYTLTATGNTVQTTPGVVISTAFNITVGTASRLAFGQQPTNAGGGATISPAVTVLVEDAGGNTVTTDTRTVSLAIGTNPSGGVLTGGGGVSAVAGIATFAGLSIDKTGNGYTLVASSTPVLTSATSNAFNITTGGVTHFTLENAGGGAFPTSETAGTAFNIRITARDAGNNVVTAFSGVSATVNITSNGTLSAGGGTTSTFTNGILDPWSITISNTGTDSITATQTTGGTAKGTSSTFVVNSGPLNNFLVENFGGGAIPQQTAGAPFNIRITARDALNNTVTGFTNTATLTSNAGLTSPAGGITAAFAAGVLTSQSVTLTWAGSANRTITCTFGAAVGTSAAFTIVASTPAAIGVSAGDIQSAAVGAVYGTALAALVSDAYANPVSGATVTFTSPNSGATGTWAGSHSTTATTSAAGIATAGAFTANTTSGAFVDTARVTGAASPALFHLTNTAAAASKLVIATAPSTPNTAGTIFATQPVIWVEDANNNLVTTASGTVTAARLTGTGALQGATTVNITNGVATFTNLSYNVAETMTIQFTSTGLTAATSGNIVVNPGVPSTVAFVQQPTAAIAGVAINPAVTAQIRDAYGNTIATAGTSITVALGIGSTGTLGGTLTQVTLASGTATFNDLSINLIGSKTLVASSGTYTSATSTAFTINPAAATHLAFVQQPTNANAGAAITPSITVQLRDVFNNNATAPVTNVTLAILTGTGTLSGTTTQTTNGSGLATFAGVSINAAGTKTLQATGGALTADVSQSFVISSLPAKMLAFIQPPTNALAGAAITPSITVQIEDSLGNPISNTGVQVTLNLTSGSGTLSGPNPQTTDATGLATFAGMSINLTGANKQITAIAPGLTSVTSGTFTISAGAAAALAFTTQPGGAVAGSALSTQPIVTLQDANGNVVTGVNQNVTLYLQANPGGDTLHGPTTVAVNTANGQAVFSGLNLHHAAAGYTLTAVGSTVSTTPGVVVSTPFTITPGTPYEVRVESAADGTGQVLPTQNVSSGTSIPAYSIARDQYHNFISDTVATWSLSSRTGGVKAGDLVPSGNNRSATFTGASIGTCVINATTTGIASSVSSGTITVVVAGTPSKIFVETAANGTGVVPPDTALASGRAITVYAIARDNANNFVRNVTASWSIQNITGGVVAGDITPASGKSAVFTGHVVGTGQIRADSASLSATPSGTITVTPGTPASVTATAGSGQSALIGSAFATNLQATVRDSSNNLVGANVVVTFAAPSSGAGGTFAGGLRTAPVLTNASSVATAPLFTANRTAGTYQDSAHIAGVTAPALFTLTNSPGTATTLTPVAGTTPQHTAVGNTFSVNLAVIVTDSSGNRVPGISVTFAPPTTSSTGTFVTNPTVVSDASGIATAPAYVANLIAGPDTVTATSAGVKAPARFILTNDAGGAQGIAVYRTVGDTASVASAFKDSCLAIVRDQANNPVNGVWVTFAAPSTGATATFARTGKQVDSALTANGGIAVSSAITANTVAGDYHINATTPSVNSTATFFRTNKALAATKFAIEASPSGGAIGPQQATIPFDVLITSRDVYNNPATFTGPSTSVNVSSNAPLLTGGGVVSFAGGGITQTIAVANAGTSDTIKVVRVGGAEKGASNAFTVVNPVPTVTAVAPPNARKGQTLDVVISGTGFISGTSVPSFGGGGQIIPQTWTVNTSTQMTVTVSIATTAPDSAYTVFVTNPTPGGGVGSLVGGFLVGKTPAPHTVSITPDSVARLTTKTIVIRGTGFYGGNVTKMSLGSGVTINTFTVDSVNQITANISVLVGAATGPRDVIMTNTVPAGTGGGSDTLKGGFWVTNPAPTIYSLSQTTGFRTHTSTVQFSGSNFIANVSTVSFDDTNIVVSNAVVDSATSITASVTVRAATALGSHAVIVKNAQPGGGAATLAGGYNIINPPPRITFVSPNAANRGQTVSVVIRGIDFVAGSSRVVFNPSTDITVNSTSVDSTTQITANITIGSAAALGQRLISVWTPPDAADTSGTFAFTVNLSSAPVPALVWPPNGMLYAPTVVKLRWSPSTGATQYRTQLSTVQTFASLLIDSTLADTTMSTGLLTLNGTYYWRVAAGNGSSYSSFTTPWSFVASYPAMVTIVDTVSFPTRANASDYQVTDYRMVSLPGDGPTPVAKYMSGTAGTDWWMVYDNGAASNYLTGYAAGSPFLFGGGRGFWLVKKGTWTVKDSVNAATLDANGQATIALNGGWTIIGNPFVKQVKWSDIIAANTAMGNDFPLWNWNGTGYVNVNVLRGGTNILVPYAGYYLEDTVAGLTSLKVPFKSGSGKAAVAADGSWQIGIDLNAGPVVERAVSVGVLPGLTPGYNAHDYHRPRALPGMTATVLSRPEWDAVRSDFATDIRPPVQVVESWKFEVRTTLRVPSQFTFNGVAAVPQGLQVVLIDDGRARTADLRANPVYAFTPATDVSHFRLVVGTPEGVKSQIDGLLPKVFALGNNFPNPFNPSTTIPVDVPLASEIHLTVYNILGAEVRTIYAGHAEAGRYWYTWDGRSEGGNTVASGVYIVRLTTSRGQAFVQKMMMIK